VLLDTHVLLWLLVGNSRLGHRARRLIGESPTVTASAASAWEVAVKVSSGRLRAPDAFMDRVGSAGLEWMPVTPDHAWAVRLLAGLPQADPFDRLLVAQASAEQLTFVTADRAILAAPITPAVTVLDARQ
jgi:PIN domain nuclease of toxin-antitoxin system